MNGNKDCNDTAPVRFTLMPESVPQDGQVVTNVGARPKTGTALNINSQPFQPKNNA